MTNGAEDEIFDEQDEQEMYEHHRIAVDKGQSMLRIDKYLMIRLQNASRTKIQYAAEAGCVLVNEKPVKSSYKVKGGDVISIVLPTPPRDTQVYPENIPLNIVYEDDEFLIVNKPAGMVVHPGFNNYTGTLVNALVYHLQQLPTVNGEIRPGLVHRIDKNTSGLVVIAKTEYAMTHLAKQFFDHTIDRSYYALVWGDFDEDEGTIQGNVGRSLRDRKIQAVFHDGSQGKHAITHYKVLERFGYVTLVECTLETGRTHQIRVHMQSIGHPLFNDQTYGGDRIHKGTTFSKYKQFIDNCFELIPRQALHAKSLGFAHPQGGKRVFFESELPEDFKAVLEKWRNYSKYVPSKEGE
ncbi:MAG: RluA family pseudouridine synthase [Bacteroidia bacterium]|nr:RluA family pseudouridine synthase [Bacteroidia bacterium]